MNNSVPRNELIHPRLKPVFSGEKECRYGMSYVFGELEGLQLGWRQLGRLLDGCGLLPLMGDGVIPQASKRCC